MTDDKIRAIRRMTDKIGKEIPIGDVLELLDALTAARAENRVRQQNFEALRVENAALRGELDLCERQRDRLLRDWKRTDAAMSTAIFDAFPNKLKAEYMDLREDARIIAESVADNSD